MGLTVEKKINDARKNLASLINASEKNILFTSGGTESNNIAINSHMLKINKNQNIVTTNIEHASIFNVFKQYEKKGYDVRYLSTDNKGFIDFKDIYKHCHEDSDKSLFFIRLFSGKDWIWKTDIAGCDPGCT